MKHFVTSDGYIDEFIVTSTRNQLNAMAEEAARGGIGLYYDGHRGLFSPVSKDSDATAKSAGYYRITDRVKIRGVVHEMMQKMVAYSQ